MPYPADPCAFTLKPFPPEDWLIRLTSQQKTLDIGPLDRLGWLADQTEDFRAWVATVGRWRNFDGGQFLYHAGDDSDGIYGLASGGLELTFPLLAEEQVAIHRAEVGFWIGDAAQLSGRPRMVSLVASGRTRVLHIHSRDIRALLEQRPDHWRAFYDLSARNIQTAMLLLSEVLSLTVKARVCRRLAALAERDPDVQITQDDLAKLVGVTRATLRRVLRELADEGGVETGYRNLRILDLAVLARYRDEQ